MQTRSKAFTRFTTKELKQNDTIAIKAGGDSGNNPLYVDPAQQGENPLHGG
ncbi:MAG: hypothetical protein HRU41_28075 [Saprospiraceae bacterium]|nr:hypothetical protein [Saprospiraceae bacterium]